MRRGTRNSFCEYQPIYFRRIRHPSKHDTLNHCWFDVGPASATLGQHQTNISSTYRVHWDVDWRWRSDFPPCIVTGFAHNKWISGGSRNWEEKGFRRFRIWQVLLVWFRSRGVLKCSHWLKGLAQAKIIKKRWFYFGFLIWPYDVNMSID